MTTVNWDNGSSIPTITATPYASSKEDAAVRKEENDDEMNLPLAESSTENMARSVVRVSNNGKYAAYNDTEHQIIFDAEDGTITVLDRKTGGGENLKMNFVIKDGMIVRHNPDYKPGGKEPKYLANVVPPEGLALHLSGGTTLYLEPQANGQITATVTSSKPTQDDENAGFIASFPNLGAGKLFEKSDYPEGAPAGGKNWDAKWLADHRRPHGGSDDWVGKLGSRNELWVKSMTDSIPTNAHDRYERREGRGEVGKNNDGGQMPGGFSQRSDKAYDTNGGAGHYYEWMWHDANLRIVDGPADADPEKVAQTLESFANGTPMPGFGSEWHPDGKWSDGKAIKDSSGLQATDEYELTEVGNWQTIFPPGTRPERLREMAAATREAQALLEKGDAGAPMFANPKDPAQKEAALLHGGGTSESNTDVDEASGSSDDRDADETPSGSSNGSERRYSSGTRMTLFELFSSELDYEWFNEDRDRERDRNNA